MEPVLLSGDQFILVSLLIQIGLMASLASLLATTRFYQRLLVQVVMRPADPYCAGAHRARWRRRRRRARSPWLEAISV